MKYKYRMTWEAKKESERPPDGYYVIRRKRAGLFGVFDFWSYVTLGQTPEAAIQRLEEKMHDSNPKPIFVKEWKDDRFACS